MWLPPPLLQAVKTKMAKAITARTLGDDYQARWFWLEAVRLCVDAELVERVDYDHDDESFFEDVITRYRPGKLDDRLEPLSADYWQLKYKVVQQEFTDESLISPEFIHSKTSLLQRAATILSSKTENIRLNIVTPCYLPAPFGKYVENNGGQIRFEKLPASMKTAWRTHLNLNTDAELGEIIKSLRIVRGYTPPQLIERINDRLPQHGFRQITEQATFPYDDVIRKAQQSGKQEFNRDNLTKLASAAGLWSEKQNGPMSDDYKIGIRTFERAAEYLETQCEDVLSLMEFFDGRHLKKDYSWNKDVYPKLEAFLESCVQKSKGRRCVLMLETHTSMAFAAGFILDSKCGMHVVPCQKTIVKQEVWDPNESPSDENQLFQFRDDPGKRGEPEVVLELSITHSIEDDVKKFLEDQSFSSARKILCNVESSPGKQSIRNARHSSELAAQVANHLKVNRSAEERDSHLHIFASAPNAFMFMLGRHARSFGKCFLYEYDFESGRSGAYSQSISLPAEKQK